MQRTPPSAETSPNPRRWLMLLALTGSLSMIFVDITVTGVAGPAISKALGLGAAGTSWIATSYLITLAAGMAIGGRLGDLFGKRNAFLMGIVAFAAASALCGAAGDGTTLLLGRVLQGLGACLMQPASSALVIENFAPGERGKAMGVYIGIPMSFFALGPVIGGALTQEFGWRSVFFINLPIASAAIALALHARAANRASVDRSFDWISAALIALGLPLAIYALQEGAARRDDGSLRIGEPSLVAMLGAGVMLVSLFAYRQLVVERPLVHLALFANARLRANVLLVGLMQFAMAAISVQGPLYATEVLGFDEMKAGMAQMPLLIPVILLASVAGRAYDRRGARPLARIGMVLAAVGLAVWGFACMERSYPAIATGMALLGAGAAFVMSPVNTDTLSSVPDDLRGQTSGLVQTFRQAGGATGVAFAACLSGIAGAYGQDLAHATGAAFLGGAAVALIGCVIALRMPDGGAPRARG